MTLVTPEKRRNLKALASRFQRRIFSTFANEKNKPLFVIKSIPRRLTGCFASIAGRMIESMSFVVGEALPHSARIRNNLQMEAG
jgi:hypothetical protein